MTIDLILLSFQALFLSMYGIVALMRNNGRWKLWLLLSTFILAAILKLINKEAVLEDNIIALLFVVLILNYLVKLFINPWTVWIERFIVSCIVFFSFGLILFQLDKIEGQGMVIFIYWLIVWIASKWKDSISNHQNFFLKSGTIITVFLALEPVFANILQNLKPVPTIPISSIINQQNFLLLGVFLMLLLGGFFWKEKSRS
ncbi:hypothetical protein [Ekhidna sp.]